MPGDVDLSGHQGALRRDQRQRRVASDLIVAEAIQPFSDELVTAVAEVRSHICPQQIAGPRDVAGSDGMLDRAIEISVAAKPGTRPGVQARLDLRFGPAQLRS